MKKKTDLSSSTSGLVLWNVEDLRTEGERGIKSRATCYSKCILAWTYLFTAKDRKRTSAVLEVNAPLFLPSALLLQFLTLSHLYSLSLSISSSHNHSQLSRLPAERVSVCNGRTAAELTFHT